MSKVNRANSVCVCGNHDKCSALVRYLKVSVVVAVSVSVSRGLYLPLPRPRSHWSVEHARLPECYVTYSQYSEATLHPPSSSTLSLSTDIRVHKVLICIVIDNDRPRDKPQIQVGQFPLCTPLYCTPLYLEASARVCTSM